MDATVPVIEIADHTHALSGGRPNRKMDTRHVVNDLHVSAEFFVDVVVRAFVEKVNIDLSENGRKSIRVALPPSASIMTGQFKLVSPTLLEISYNAFEESITISGRKRMLFRWV